MSNFLKRLLPSFGLSRESGEDTLAPDSQDTSGIAIVPDIRAETQPDVEYAFSEDEEGKFLSKLWDEYISTYESNESEKQNVQIRHSAFNRFASQFISSYSAVLDAMETRCDCHIEHDNNSAGTFSSHAIHRDILPTGLPRKTTPSINETSGHASEVIVQIASMLTEYLEVGDISDPSFPYDQDPPQQSVFLSDDCITISVKNVFVENDRTPVLRNVSNEGKREGSEVKLHHTGPSELESTFSLAPEWEDEAEHTSTHRSTVLHILHSLSTLMHWKHNRRIVANRLGQSFAQEVVGVLQFFSTKIDEVTVSWTAARELALRTSHWATSDLRQDTDFIISSLLAVSRLIACSCPTMREMAKCTATGFLPNQPWTESAFEAMGIDIMPLMNTSNGDLQRSETLPPVPMHVNDSQCESGVDDAAGVVQDSMAMNTSKPEVDNSREPRLGKYKASRDHSSREQRQLSNENVQRIKISDPIISSAMGPLQVSSSGDAWSGMLLSAGVDRALLSLLRKIVILSRILTSSPDNWKPDGNESTQNSDWNDSSLDEWAESVLIPWKACTILQNEVLFALLAITTSHLDAASKRFMACDGPQTLNMLLLDPTSICTGKSSVAVDLVLLRGILCLRLNELLNRVFSVQCDSNKDYDGRTTVLLTESIGWFLSWMRAAYRYEDEYEEDLISRCTCQDDTVKDTKRQRPLGDTVVVGCAQTPYMYAPPLVESDLWPWSQQPFQARPSVLRGGENSIALFPKKTGANYRLCHDCSERDTYETSTKSTDLLFPNVFQTWIEFVVEKANADEGNDTAEFDHLPWFLCGRSARAWQAVFSVLASTCLAKGYFSAEMNNVFNSKRNHVLTNFTTVCNSVAMALDEPINLISSKLRPNHALESGDRVPIFEMHYLLFIGRCIKCEILSIIEACFEEEPEIWSMLFSSKFLLGGRESVEKLIRHNISASKKSAEDMIPVEPYLSGCGDSFLGPLLRCSSNKYVNTELVRENVEHIAGYTWMYLHDCVLDLTSYMTTELNRPPASRIVSTKRSFDAKPIIHALQTSSESGYDDVSFRLLRWMKWYLNLIEARGTSIRNIMSSQFFRASLAVCGYHLGDIKASAILHKEHIVDPLESVQKTRLFMWPARRAAIEIIVHVLDMPDCDRWLKLFSSSKPDSSLADSDIGKTTTTVPPRSISAKQGKSPAHVTLMLLFVDTRLRGVLCYILMKVLSRIVVETLGERNCTDDDNWDDGSLKSHVASSEADTTVPSNATLAKSVSLMYSGKANMSRKISKDYTNSRSYDACIRDMIMDLFEIVKWSSRQPEWYNGASVAGVILSSFTQFLRSYKNDGGVMKQTQRWFRRGAVMSEVVTSLITCISFASDNQWTDEDKITVVHQGFSYLTAVMACNSKNKSEFKSTMMSRRSGRSIHTGASPSSGGASTYKSSGPKFSTNAFSKGANSIVLKYDDFIDMILQACPEPTVETILVLIEMVLDGPLTNSKDLISMMSLEEDQISNGFFADQFDRPQICNMNAIPIIFGILSSCSNNLQKCILNSFHQLVVGRASLVNISNCSQMRPSLLDLVLDHLPEQEESTQNVSVKLLQTLGRHSITVAQLKRMFQMMRSNGDYRPAYTTFLLRSLQGMIDDDESPRHSFVFGGVNSGLAMPSMPRWPAQSAYTISLWLRVESPQWNAMADFWESQSESYRHSIQKEYRPYVLCLRCNNGNGIEVYLKRSGTHTSKFRIHIRCHNGPDSVDTFQVPGAYVNEGRWHYLAISHHSSGFRSNSEAEVMLDDHFVRHKLSYPRFTDTIEAPLLGDCMPKFRDDTLNTTMRGQMSAMYLFTDALTEGQLRGIYGLGPSYFYAFEPFTTVHRDLPPASSSKKQTVDPVLSILDGSLTSLIALSYNPAVWKGDLYLDNTPEKNQVKWKFSTLLSTIDNMTQYSEKSTDVEIRQSESDSTMCFAQHVAGKMHARSLPGTYRSTISDVRIALNSLGGIRVLLPLFTQFDQPRVKPVSADGARRKGSGEFEIVDDADSDICSILLEVILTLLVKTSENESFLKDYQGVALIAYFLERMSPQHMSMKALNLVFRIRDRLNWNTSYSNDVFEHLLLNFKIWVFTSFEVQQHLLREIDSIVCSIDARHIREMGVLNKLLDALYLLYDYDKPKISLPQYTQSHDDIETIAVNPDRRCASTSSSKNSFSADTLQQDGLLGSVYHADKWIHYSSGRVEGVKLTGKSLHLIRAHILRVITKIIRNGNGDGIVVPEDVAALVRYVIVTSSSKSKVEALSVLLSLLKEGGTSTAASIPKVLLGLSTGKGLLALLPLVSNSDVQVRLYTLLILCMSLKLAAVYDDIGRLEMLKNSSSDELQPPMSNLSDSGTPISKEPPLDIPTSVSDDNVHNTPQSPPPSRYLTEFTTAIKGTPEDSSQVDTFTRLGLPKSSLVGVVTWVQDEIINSVSMDDRDENNCLPTKQAKIVAQALQFTLLGESCSHLHVEVDRFSSQCIHEDESDSELYDAASESSRTNDSVDSQRGETIYPSDISALNSPVASRASLRSRSDSGSKGLSPIHNVAEKEGRLMESAVCIPMIFPAILGLVGQKHVPVSLRLSIMVNLRTFILQHSDNCDRILRISAWQDFFFQLIVEETSRVKAVEKSADMNCKSIQRHLVKAHALIDTCLRTLCDIQFTAVRIGRPVGSPIIVSPVGVSGKLTSQLTVDRIFKETKCGQRQLGVSVLRETMSFLRIYHDKEKGIDMYPTAFNLLQHTVNALQRESDMLLSSRKSAVVDTEGNDMKHYFKKILSLNIWLVGAVVLEFLTFPLTLNTAPLVSTSPTLPDMGSLVEDYEQESVHHPGDLLARLEQSDSIHTHPRKYLSGTNVDLHHESLLEHPNINDKKTSRPNSLLRDTFRESATSFSQYEEVVWNLVDSLMHLMGPLGPMATNPIPSHGGKSQIANQVGYLTGQKSASVVDQSIREIVSPGGLSYSASMGTNNTSQSSSKKPTGFNQAAGGVCWIMIRVLCSVFTHGGMVADAEVSIESNKPMLALMQLKALVSCICDQNLENFGFEINNIIGRLSAVLQVSTLTVESEWVRGAVNLLMDLVSLQRGTLLTLIMSSNPHEGVYLSGDDDTRPSVFASAMSAVRTSTALSRFGSKEIDHCIQSGTPDSLPDFMKLLNDYSEKPPDSYSTADITLDAIRTALGLPPDFRLSWDMWTSVMIPVMEEADEVENEFRRERLTEMGLHKHSEEVRFQLQQQRALESKVFQEVAHHSAAAHVHISEVRMKSLREQLRVMEANDRRIISKWNHIISHLANERGPWGFGNDANADVFWMVDRTESNMRTTPVLRRNESGTRHQVASFLSRGKSDTTSAISVSDDSTLEAEKRRPLSAIISPQGLWRDLMKYQKKNSETDALLDMNDKLDLEDDVDESKETTPEGKVLFRAAVEIITNATNSAGGSTHGTVEITKTKMTFTRSSDESFSFQNKTNNTEFLWACQCFPSTTWNTADIINIYCRNYQLRFVAVEIFFTSRLSVFINLFENTNQRQLVDCIRRQVKPPYIQPHYGYRPSSIISRAVHQASGRTMTQAWVHRDISNYEYLMYLNTVAGRSFNDMSQYPVFPWVISNYTSSKLNLTDPKNFRDLSWSMGAQNESQREIFMQKYRDLEDCYYSALEERKHTHDPSMAPDCLPPFHYGSHFSTMGFVLWYLIRMEPFTSLNIWMQDGRFDKPDRIFDTIELCYRGCTSNQADVKELIPEFFYCPEFLENVNGISMGTTSANKELGPVGLPPWAKNPHDFIRQHRNALESEYVSAFLHNWIDLVFGYKQRPPHMGGSEAAVHACNVYFHLTYAGAVDLDDLRENDVPLYNQMVRQIDNYGQTPTQLFTRPHPQRQPLDKVDIVWPLASVVLGADTIRKGAPLPERPHRVVCFKEHVVSVCPVVYIAESTSWDKLITIDSSRIVATHFWQIRPPDVVPPFQFKPDTIALKYSQGTSTGGFNMSTLRLVQYNSATRERRIGAPFAPHQLLRSDYVQDTSLRRIKIPAGNKALFEKEEAARSNWRVRSQTRGMSVSSASTSNTSERKRTNTESDVEEESGLNLSDREGVGVRGTSSEQAPPLVLNRVDEHISSHLFAVLPEHRLVFSCGHWDYSFKATAIDSGRLLQSVSQHRDVVTCMDIATDFQYTWLVTGSRDCTLVIWDVNPHADRPISQQPKHVLYGHDDAVNCVAVNAELDVVASGSDDGTIIVHKLREGIYIRSISVEPSPVGPNSSPSPSSSGGKVSSWRGVSSVSPDGPTKLLRSGSDMSTTSEVSVGSAHPERSVNRTFLISKRRVHFVGISTEGFLVAYSNDDSALYTFSINGRPQARKHSGERLHAFCMSEDGRVLVTGGERGLLVMRSIHSLELSNVGSKWEFDAVLDGQNVEEQTKPFNSPIRSIYLTKHERHLIVGLENGELRILAQDSDYLRKRLHSKLMEIGIIENI